MAYKMQHTSLRASFRNLEDIDYSREDFQNSDGSDDKS